MPEARWKGYIKDYSGSTMMQCKIHKNIDYVKISSTIKQQRDFIIEQIHRIMNKQIYNELDFVQKGEENFEFNEVSGLLEAGWTQTEYDSAKGTEEKTFENQSEEIIKILVNHENAWPFKQAVNPRQAPDYYTVINDPIWLEKIQENLDNAYYTHRDMFKKDIIRVFENARIYNAKETIYYKFAEILQSVAQPLLDKLKETDQDTQIRKQKQSQMKNEL